MSYKMLHQIGTTTYKVPIKYLLLHSLERSRNFSIDLDSDVEHIYLNSTYITISTKIIVLECSDTSEDSRNFSNNLSYCI